MEPKVIYDSFNARYLTFQEIAESFIPNQYFRELLDNNHSILMGPRGCGKTTLLKMLSPASLISWDKKHKTNLFEEIPFIAVYIPTDIHWKKQLEQLKKDFEQQSFVTPISRATVTVNVLISIIKTFSYLVNHLRSSSLEDFIDEEVNLSKALIDNWKLNKPIAPTLDALEIALLEKIALLNVEIRKKHYRKEYELNLDDFYYYDYFDLIKIAFTVFNTQFPSISKKRWALCFDELEIAPEWLQFELLEFLRSREQTILFKLTTAPLISVYKEVAEEFSLINASRETILKW